MRKTAGAAGILGLLTVALLVAGGSAIASSQKVFGVKDCGKPEVRPPRIVLACGDGALWINAIDYHGWGGKQVRAHAVLHAKTCNPICPGSRVKDYAVKIRLYRIGHTSCGGRFVRAYRRIHVHPTGTSPPRFAPFRDTELFCN